MEVLSDAARWLERQRHEHMTIPVKYKRDSDLLTLYATVGKTDFEVSDDYGRITKIESRDFLVRSCDLLVGGQVTTPQLGDQIIENGFVYEVMSTPNQPQWRYSDMNRQTIRIHTKQIGRS